MVIKMNKKYKLVVIIALFLCMTICGCNQDISSKLFPGMYDVYSGKRPQDYGTAKWISDNPHILFVIEDAENNEGELWDGEVAMVDKLEKIVVSFEPIGTNGISIYSPNLSETLLEGSCKFYSDKVIVSVNKETDQLFDGEFDIITFYRVEL